MLFHLTHKEKEAVKGALMSATHKMAKLVQQGRLVSDTEFMAFTEKAYKGDHFVPTIDSVSYTYSEHSGPHVVIHSHLPGLAKFRSSFYMSEPYRAFEDRTPIPHDIKVEIFSHWSEEMEEEVWEDI